MFRRMILLLASLLLVVAAACGGGGVEEEGDGGGGDDIKGAVNDDEDEDEDATTTTEEDEDEDDENDLDAGGDVPDGQDPSQILGSDDDVDAFIEDCFEGNLFACDTLFLVTSGGSDQEAYGLTCGGRVDEGDVPSEECAEEFDQELPDGVNPGDLGDDADLDRAAEGCFDGDFVDCQDLFDGSLFDSAYEAYAQACGGRLPNNDLMYTDDAVLDATCERVFEGF